MGIREETIRQKGACNIDDRSFGFRKTYGSKQKLFRERRQKGAQRAKMTKTPYHIPIKKTLDKIVCVCYSII